MRIKRNQHGLPDFSAFVTLKLRLSCMSEHHQRMSHDACVRQGRLSERWGAGVETQKNVRGVFGGWGRVPFNETYAPSLSTIYDGA